MYHYGVYKVKIAVSCRMSDIVGWDCSLEVQRNQMPRKREESFFSAPVVTQLSLPVPFNFIRSDTFPSFVGRRSPVHIGCGEVYKRRCHPLASQTSTWLFSLLHRACCRVTQLLHQLLHIYKIYEIYTLEHKNAPTCFGPRTIIREPYRPC